MEEEIPSKKVLRRGYIRTNTKRQSARQHVRRTHKTLRDKSPKSKSLGTEQKCFFNFLPYYIHLNLHIPSRDEPIIPWVRQAALVTFAHNRIPVLRHLVVSPIANGLRQ